MKRRAILRGAAAALAAGGLAATRSTPGVAATPRTSPTIFDFGAAGDGKTDDSRAFLTALDMAAREGRMVIVPGFTYLIGKPVEWISRGHATRQWGLACQGATLRSALNGRQDDVFSMTSNHTVRYFNITGGLTIKGTGSERHGFRISSPWSGGKYFYNFAIDRLSVEGAGGDGLVFEGNVFESQLTSCYFQDAKGNGATFAHYKKGVCSSINLIGCYFNQNGKHGMEATNFDGPHGGATDIRVIGGYCRDNKLYGFRYNNGTSPGAAITQVGFENNYKSGGPGDEQGAHVFAKTRMQLRECAGYNESGGATYLLRGWFTDLTTLDGCSQSSGGKMRETGKSRLVQVNGSEDGHVVLRSCRGGVAVAPGNKASWQAINCTGTGPRGKLDPRKTIDGA